MRLSPADPKLARLIDALERPHESGADGRDVLILLGMMGALRGRDARFDRKKTLILFTSDRRAEADALYASDPKRYAIIHQTPAGALLEKLRTFQHLPGPLAYLAWHICAADLVLRNKPRRVVIVGNPENEFSTLWNFELPLLLKIAPRCKVMRHDDGRVLSGAEMRGMCRGHFAEFVRSGGTQGLLAERWPKSGLQGGPAEDGSCVPSLLAMLRPRMRGLGF